MRVLRLVATVFIVLLIVSLSVFGGVVLDRRVLAFVAPPATIPADASSQFELLAQAWNLVQHVYVDRAAVQPQALGYGAIQGMVDALGDTGHSRFLSPQMVKQEDDLTQGRLVGIGAQVEMKDGHVVIAAVFDNSPAQKGGLHAGNIILKVDGQNVAGLSLSEVVSHVTGPEATQVTVTILDPTTGQMRDVILTRAVIQINYVSWHMLPGTSLAHLHIALFSQNMSHDLIVALQEIQQQKASALILDLRNNPGGLLDEAIATTSQFLASGNVLLVRDAEGQVKPIAVQPGGLATDIPMVVLIDQGTASAAEIVAGALQDANRAKVVGETTFGTGTVLNQFPLSDGSAVMLATQEWLTPKGRVIWHQGLAPDMTVSLPQDADPIFPMREDSLTAGALSQIKDAQLLQAIDLLQ